LTDVAPGRHIRAVIVGAGPSGFYTAEQLLAAGVEVDVLDTLPTPFGLVRSGVAPDHPKIKSVTRIFEKIAARPGFRFIGGVTLGDDITRADLLDQYHVVVYAFGTAEDNRLRIAGEDRPGSHPATHFVSWYNGHPDGTDQAFNLSCRRAVVIGNGNVALDVARMLVLHPEELATTDTADHAIAALARSQITEVVVVGRRGPAQAAFSNPELCELGKLRRADVSVDEGDLELDSCSAAWLDEQAPPVSRRNMETLRTFAARGPTTASHRIVLRFRYTPVEIVGQGDAGPVTGIRVVRNRIESRADGTPVAVPTNDEETIECGLVVRAIGYRARAVDEIPFDHERGLIRNTGGRVIDEHGRPQPGEYAVGWVKRGPSGVIGTNKKDASDTVARILQDAADGLLNPLAVDDRGLDDGLCGDRVTQVVTWDGWRAIDAAERAAGQPDGRDRIKIVRRPDLLAAAQLHSST
jgi:ferredoxin/flavodoxin---NADP+ reductase